MTSSTHWSVTAPCFSEEDEKQEKATMSEEEVEQSWADMHGKCAVLDDEEIVKRGLDEMEKELNEISCDEKPALLMAETRCPDQCSSEHKRLFLRREAFDAERAARRLVDYWQQKLKWFGPEKSFIPLALDNAMREDTAALNRGLLRLLPVTDSFGRCILFCDISLHDATMYSMESMMRAIWYMLLAAIEDETTQNRGAIFVLYLKQSTLDQFDRKLLHRLLELEDKFVPIRFRSFHICHPGACFDIERPILQFLLGKRLRARMDVHQGTEEEVLIELDEYGMPPDRVPSIMGGKVVLDHERWLSNRRSLRL